MTTKLTFTIHGLDVDNKLVRATIFARKFQTLLSGLYIADRSANGAIAHEFIIEDLEIGSALVKLRERQKGRRRDARSCVDMYSAALRAVYDGQPTARNLPPRLVANFKALSSGSEKNFQHAELDFENSNIVRIDDYLLRQSERIIEAPKRDVIGERGRFFRGISRGTFDGALRVIDSRGQLLKAILVTTAGEKEIECIVQRDMVEQLAQQFEHRVRIEGTAHYESDSALPIRVDVRLIRPIKPNADLRRWRGAFEGNAAMKEHW